MCHNEVLIITQRCTVCTHEFVKDIDNALIEGVSFRNISAQYGVSKSSVYRHKHSHLSQKITKEKEISDFNNLCGDVESLKTICNDILDELRKRNIEV